MLNGKKAAAGSAELAARLNEALPRRGGITDAKIAAECGISKAGVGEWRKTGRIAKHHLTKLAELSGRPLEWWLAGTLAQPSGQPGATAMGRHSAEPSPTPYHGDYSVKLAPPAVTLDLSADCLVVWQQLQQLPPREREEWRAKLDFAVAKERMRKLGLIDDPDPDNPGGHGERARKPSHTT